MKIIKYLERPLPIIISLALILTFTACSKVEPPETAVKGFFDTLKQSDIESAGMYVSGGTDSFKFDDSGQEKIIKLAFSKLDYEITSVSIKGNKAIVKTKVTAPDLVKITGEVIIKLLPQLFELAFSDDSDAKAESEELLIEMFTKKIADPDIALLVTETDIKLIMDNEKKKWLIEPDDNLINAMTGNAAEAFSDLSEDLSDEDIISGEENNSFDDRIWVMDSADLLDEVEEEKLNEMLSKYENETTVQLALKTVESLNGESIEDYSLRFFNENGFGQKETNNGALIVFSDRDRVFRISLGYGLEWCISDDVSDEIIDKMIPYLREGKYYEGFNVGFSEIIKLTKDVPWNIGYTEVAEAVSASENTIGEIISFNAGNVEENGNKVIAKTLDGYDVEIITTKHMSTLLEQAEKGHCVIVGRIKSIQPISIELLSVNESN